MKTNSLAFDSGSEADSLLNEKRPGSFHHQASQPLETDSVGMSVVMTHDAAKIIHSPSSHIVRKLTMPSRTM